MSRPSYADVGVQTTMDDAFHLCASLRAEVEELRKKVIELESRVPSAPLPPPLTFTPEVTETNESSHSDESSSRQIPLTPIEPPDDIDRRVVINKLPFNASLGIETQTRMDWENVMILLALADCACTPVSVYRMPIPWPIDPSHSRITKVVLPTTRHAELFVNSYHRRKRDPRFIHVWIARDDVRRHKLVVEGIGHSSTNRSRDGPYLSTQSTIHYGHTGGDFTGRMRSTHGHHNRRRNQQSMYSHTTSYGSHLTPPFNTYLSRI